MNNRAVMVLLVIVALLVAGLLLRQADLAWMTLPFLAYLGLGLLQAPAQGQVSLRVVRSVEARRHDGQSAVQVKVAVLNEGVAVSCLCLSDPLPPGASLLEGHTRSLAALHAGEETEFSYTFQTARGRFTWQSLLAVASDPLRLIDVAMNLPALAEILVQPELRKIRPFALRAQRTLPSPGSIPARRSGSGANFWGVREYHPGDPLRRLDWRLTARHPRQLFTKEFEQEAMADIGLILDARQKTSLQRGDDCLFEHSVRAAASLAEVFLRQGNHVSLLVWGDPMIPIFPGCGKVQLRRILRTLAGVSLTSRSSLEMLHFIPVQMFASHSLILVISPLADDDGPLFPRLRAYGYQVAVISPDPFDYARPLLPCDRTTRTAARLARLERRIEIAKITSLRIPVIDWQVSQPLSPLVRQALGRAQVQVKLPGVAR